MSDVSDIEGVEPDRWLNYQGDTRGSTFPNGVAGPDEISGQYLRPVDAVYDPETNMTRVGFVVAHFPASGLPGRGMG